MARADNITQLSTNVEQYSDFLNNFDRHPLTGTLGKTTNEAAVRQSIKNLIFTMRGERLFQPLVGGDITRYLFEPLTQLTAYNISNSIRDTIKYNEKRANLINVAVYPTADQNSVIVNVVFSLINSNEPITLDVVLRRVR